MDVLEALTWVERHMPVKLDDGSNAWIYRVLPCNNEAGEKCCLIANSDPIAPTNGSDITVDVHMVAWSKIKECL